MTDPATGNDIDPGLGPEVERADEVEDYTGEVPRPSGASPSAAGPADTGEVAEPSGFGDGDVADIDGDMDGDGATSDPSLDDPSLDDVDVAALLAERDQLHELAVRLQADFENFRRRTNTQHATDIERATGRLAEALLPVLDAAEAAYLQHPEEIGPLLNVMLGELRKHGLETLDLDGQPFDPEVADAVAHEPGTGGDVVVADVLRSGYRWKGRTLRPAMVRTTD